MTTLFVNEPEKMPMQNRKAGRKEARRENTA
jgi:hypothetical protein